MHLVGPTHGEFNITVLICSNKVNYATNRGVHAVKIILQNGEYIVRISPHSFRKVRDGEHSAPPFTVLRDVELMFDLYGI